MKNIKKSFLLPFLMSTLLFGVFGCTKENIKVPTINDNPENALIEAGKQLSTRSASNQSVTGGGTTTEFGKVSTFVFNAIKKSDGSVTGQMNYKFRGGPVTWAADINCLTIIDSKTAVLSGVITKAEGLENFFPPFAVPFFEVGRNTVFTVVDNGQGAGSPPDLISDIWVSDNVNEPFNCNNIVPPVYLPISGNIQIKK